MTTALPTSGCTPDQYVFITPVWGEKYVERFVKISLRTQLSEGNLGSIPPGKGLYLIFTRKNDVAAIKRSPAFRQLKATLPVSVRSLDDLPDPRFNDHPHDLQTAAYIRGIRAAAGRETAFVFLTPDILLGDGTLRSLVRRSEEGRRVILVAGIRMTTEGAVSCVATHRTEGRADAPVPPRDLVRVLLDNLHPLSRGHFVAPNGSVQLAQHLYWPVADHGLLVRGFHVHPLMVWPRHPEAGIRNTIDDEYVERACPDRSDWYTVTDSDEFCMLEFSDRTHKHGMLDHAPVQSDLDAVRFVAEATTPSHREHVLHQVRYHTRDIVPEEWAEANVRSNLLVNRFLNLFEMHVAKRGQNDLSEAEMENWLWPAAEASIGGNSSAAWALRWLTRPLYRLLNYPLYHHVGRLNAELIHLRTLFHITRAQFTASNRQLALANKQLEEIALARAEKGGSAPRGTVRLAHAKAG
jgi:hypothetical protein